MNFLKTLFWVVVTAVAVVFSANNWSPIFPVQLWGGFVADTHVPVLMIGSFLLGLVPMMAIHRARLWSLRRRLATLEGTAAAAPSPPVAPPPDEPVVLRR
jgi:putative membrane protein